MKKYCKVKSFTTFCEDDIKVDKFRIQQSLRSLEQKKLNLKEEEELFEKFLKQEKIPYIVTWEICK